METCSFWDRYKADIVPKLEEIDIVLKTFENDLTVREVSEILMISEKEILQIIHNESIENIDKEAFLKIMEQGSNFICSIFRREIECGSPYVYTKENISYIYDIPIDKISYACKLLNIEIITTNVLPMVFAAV